MGNILKLAAMALATFAMAGCQTQPQPLTSQATASRSALDVRPVRTVRPAYAMPQRVTPPDELMAPPMVMPVLTSTPDGLASNSQRMSAASSASFGAADGEYKVKKGDTLFHIAKTHYGDGKKWTQIASANPGLTPRSLKVGQTIMIP